MFQHQRPSVSVLLHHVSDRIHWYYLGVALGGHVSRGFPYNADFRAKPCMSNLPFRANSHQSRQHHHPKIAGPPDHACTCPVGQVTNEEAKLSMNSASSLK
jgi:hypothetical protein